MARKPIKIEAGKPIIAPGVPVRDRGRPPIGEKAMSVSERVKRHRQKNAPKPEASK